MITIDFKHMVLPERIRVLDIGCGSGRHTAAAYGLKQAFVVGADPNCDDLVQARQRLDLHHRLGAHGSGRRHLAAADAIDLPFQDECFDLVICSEVLEHIPNHLQAICEVVRILRPGGQLAVSVPRRWPESICWALSRSYRRTAGGHLRIYTARRLIEIIRKQGMTHRYTHYAHSLHSPYWWLKCLLGVERDHLWPVRMVHRLLTWDIMAKPRLTRVLDRLLNPICGKSIVLYFRKI